MKLVTFRASVEDAARLGVIVGDLVVDVAAFGDAYGEPLPDTMLGLIDAGAPGVATLRACLDRADGNFPIHTATALDNVKLLAPIPRPRKNIFGIGLNYVEHVAESAAALDTAVPVDTGLAAPPGVTVTTSRPCNDHICTTVPSDSLICSVWKLDADSLQAPRNWS